MDHDLISLARRAGIDAVVQGRLGEQPQGISLLLRDGGRFLGNVRRARIAGLRTGSLIQRLARGSQSLHEHGADPTSGARRPRSTTMPSSP